MCVLPARDVKSTVRGSAKGSQTTLLDRACGKNFHEMVHDVLSVVNNYGFNFNVRELIEIGSVDGEVFVHPGVSDGKRGVIGALSDNQHPGSSDLWTSSENTMELALKPGFIHVMWPNSARAV